VTHPLSCGGGVDLGEADMAINSIGVINYSTMASDADVTSWLRATQTHMGEVARIWSLPAPTLQLVPVAVHRAEVDAWMVIVDDARQRFGLGWHDTGPNGEPAGYVLVNYTRQFQQQASRVFSHEVIEMCVDPKAERSVQIGGVLYMVEPGDILSLDSQGTEVNGVLCSGYAYPSYYRLETGQRYDSGNYLTGPCPTMVHGTMLMYWGTGSWQQRMLAPTPEIEQGMLVHEASRRHRRNLGHDRLTRSSPAEHDRRPDARPI